MDLGQSNNNNNNGGVGGSYHYGASNPFIVFQPSNLFTFISNFSPIIVATFVLAMSFYGPTPSFKGLIYLAFLIAGSFLRNYIYQAADWMPVSKQPNNNSCNFVRYSKFCNTTFSLFVLAFTIVYLSIPMFQRNSVNIVVFALLVFYLLIDIGNKILRGCIKMQTDIPYVLLELSFGSLFATMIVMLMQLGGSDKYLFYTDLQNNGVVCSRPKKQTMKCSVYKNGQLVQ